jgi:hypothetical protein
MMIAMMTELPHLYRIEGDKLRIYPHAGQAKVLLSKRRFIFALAGSQSGKTVIGPVWLYKEMLQCGEGDYFAISPSYPLQQKKLLPEYQAFYIDTLGIGKYHKANRVMEINDHDGKHYNIYFGSADNPDSLESATVKAAHVDEIGQDSFKVEAWDAIKRRLSIYRGRVLATTTIYNLGWMKYEVYDRWIEGDNEIEVIQFSSTMNPAFPKEEYEARKRTMPEWKFKMFYDGEYSRPAGMIYSDYNEDIHKVVPFHIPFNWPRYVGIDPGGSNTALVWIAADIDTGRYYLYRSSLEGDLTTPDHVRRATDYGDSKNVVRWVGGAPGETQFRMDWTECGINVEKPYFSDVEVGIDMVIRLFKTNKLFIFNTRENYGIFNELNTYSRELDQNGQATEKIKDKKKYHRLDALRYVAQCLVVSEKEAPGTRNSRGHHNAEVMYKDTKELRKW